MPSGHETTTDSALSAANWLGFSMMCIGMFMAILDVQVVATSLPTIQAALAMRPEQMSWIQTAYLIAEVIAIPLSGFLTRTLTMRWLFVASVLLFTIASIGCAASNTFEGLIVWRVLQGFSGGTLIPAVFSAVFLLFPQRQQGVATTIAGILAVLAPTVGPIVGGWITDVLSWHWLFLINVMPGVLSALVATRSLPRHRLRLGEFRSLDIVALGCLTLSLTLLEIALKDAPERGWGSSYIFMLLVICVLAMAAFAWRSFTRRNPVVNLRTFQHRNFAIGCILSFALGIGLFGSVYLMPVFLAFVRHHSALEIGAIMLVTGTAQLLTAPLAVWLEQRVSARLLTAFGFALLAGGLGWSFFQTPRTDFEGMIGPQIMRGVAIMFCLLPPTRLALGNLATVEVPDASGVFNLMRNLGGAIGIALIDTVIFGRTAIHARSIESLLMAGDDQTSSFVGIPTSMLRTFGTEGMSLEQQLSLKDMIETAATTQSINEAWMLIAMLIALALVFIPFSDPTDNKRGDPLPD